MEGKDSNHDDSKSFIDTSHADPELKQTTLDLSTYLPEVRTGQRRSVVLFESLVQVQEKLKKKEKECEDLTKHQLTACEEVQDFTASLFEEANKMIQEAHLKRIAAEKELADALLKMESFQAEVKALKKIIASSSDLQTSKVNSPVSNFIKGHKRSTSHHNFGKSAQDQKDTSKEDKERYCMRYELFQQWRVRPQLDECQEFIKDLIDCDVFPCLHFPNKELVDKVREGIFCNTLAIEPLNKLSSKRYCCLLQKEVLCEFVIKLEAISDPHVISRPSRDRIIAVCDLVSYLRYISLGLVKSADYDAFKEILQRLKRMCLVRLGIDES